MKSLLKTQTFEVCETSKVSNLQHVPGTFKSARHMLMTMRPYQHNPITHHQSACS